MVIQIHEHVTNGPLKSSETGYSNAKELWSAIVVLPEIGVQNKKADAESLHEYVQVVKRIRVTKSEVVESALGMLSHNPRYPLGDVQATGCYPTASGAICNTERYTPTIKLTWGRQMRENPLHLTSCDYNKQKENKQKTKSARGQALVWFSFFGVFF